MPVIGCDIPVVVSGTEPLATSTGVWTKTHFRQEGSFLIATTYLVAAGSPVVFEMRIDLQPLEKIAEKVHAALHARMAASPAAVGFSFSGAWKSIKKTAKKIGKSKLVKAVGGAVSAVTKNKLVQALNPMAAVASHTLNKAAGGKGTIPGTLGRLVSAGAGAALAVVPGGAAAHAARPQTLAAFGAAKSAINAINTGRKLVSTAQTAQRFIAAGNKATGALVHKVASRLPIPNAKNVAAARALATAQAKAALARTSAATRAKIVATVPAIKKAAEIKAKLAQPAVKAALAKAKSQADSAQRAVQQVRYDARYATGAQKVDAQKSAAIINLVAQNDAKIASVAQKNAGGLPGILIDKNGRTTKGRFVIRAMSTNKNAPMLYLSPKSRMRGTFQQVAGYPSRISNDIIGSAPSRISNDIIGACFQVQNSRPQPNVRVSGAPGLIGCDCGSEF
jgi:hypothetical protein